MAQGKGKVREDMDKLEEEHSILKSMLGDAKEFYGRISLWGKMDEIASIVGKYTH